MTRNCGVLLFFTCVTMVVSGARGNLVSTDALKIAMGLKQDTLTTGEDGNLQGAGSVTVEMDADGKITISGTDTTYDAATAETAGLTKLYSYDDISGSIDSPESLPTDGALTVSAAIQAMSEYTGGDDVTRDELMRDNGDGTISNDFGFAYSGDLELSADDNNRYDTGVYWDDFGGTVYLSADKYGHASAADLVTVVDKLGDIRSDNPFPKNNDYGFAYQSDVDSLQSALQTDIGTLQSDVSSLETDIGTLQYNLYPGGGVSNNYGFAYQSDVDSLLSDVASLQSDLGNKTVSDTSMYGNSYGFAYREDLTRYTAGRPDGVGTDKYGHAFDEDLYYNSRNYNFTASDGAGFSISTNNYGHAFVEDLLDPSSELRQAMGYYGNNSGGGDISLNGYIKYSDFGVSDSTEYISAMETLLVNDGFVTWTDLGGVDTIAQFMTDVTKLKDVDFPALQEQVSDLATVAEQAGAALDLKQDKLNSTNVVTTGTGNVVTGISASDGVVTATKGNVGIPIGSATATSYATMWIEE